MMQKRFFRFSLCVFLVAVFVITAGFVFRTFVKNICVDILDMNNSFTNFVFSDKNYFQHTEYDIDWEKLYPFDEDTENSANKSLESNILQKVENKVYSIESKVQNQYTTMTLFYNEFIYAANGIEELMNWSIVPFSEYNSVIKAEDDYLLTQYSEVDTTPLVENAKEFNDFCTKQGIPFLYINAPSKTTEDDYISGIADFSNQNADALLKGLSDNFVDYIDIRQNIANDGLDNKKLFFKTDHHWKPKTGLYATTIIAEYLNKNYNFNIDTDKFDISQYKTVTYKGCFLGSQGKKVTLARAEAEDFNLLYPNYKTSFDLVVDDLKINETGDFSLIYDLNYLECDDPMENNLYSAYGYANRPLMRYKNHITNNDSKILIVKDSFANTVAPFFAMGVDSCDVIDLRYFNGSLKSYISSTKPDCVIVLYSQGSIQSIDYSNHFSLFDFR